MDNDKLNQIKMNLSTKLKEYIDAIIEVYGKYINEEKLNSLTSIKDYTNIIKIYDYGSINAMANDTEIDMPLCADKVLQLISKVPGYSINKNHKTYDENTLIQNNNTFVNYIIHVFVSGVNTEKYFEDMLLHETLHFCGSGGASALKEGINELLTRKLALEKGFKTNGCGYPKEVKLAYELQNVFGEEILNQIAFINTEYQIFLYLKENLGLDAANLYMDIYKITEDEFNKKYYSYINSYNGFSGIMKKTLNYRKIDYTKAYELINNYKLSYQDMDANASKKDKCMV